VISYRYSGAPMSADDRLLNPLGFEVTRYRRDAETVPASVADPVQAIVPGIPAGAPGAEPSSPGGQPALMTGKPTK
jgi:type IV secretion system protein VirB8